MAVVVPDAAEDVMLQNILNKTAPQNQTLKLYTAHSGGNTVDPAESDTESSFTEATGSGYAAFTLTGSSWSTTPGAPTQASYAQQVWTFTGALGNVYGYYVVQVTSGKILWAERFSDGPYNVVNNGDQVKVTPKITLS